MTGRRVFAASAVGLVLAACTTSPSGNHHDVLNTDSWASAAPSGVGERELTPPERKIIVDAVSLSIREPGSAKFRWAKIPATAEGSVNYCGIVDAKSPYPAYNGRQAFIVETTVADGKVSAAVVGLIAGGKDAAIVSKMCAKYGLNPNNAS